MDDLGDVVAGLFEVVFELCFAGLWQAALTLTVLIGGGVGVYFLIA